MKFLSGFKAKLADLGASPTTPDLESRIADERRVLTAGRPKRVAVRTVQQNFRFSRADADLLGTLAVRLGASRAEVVVRALRELAAKEGIGS